MKIHCSDLGPDFEKVVSQAIQNHQPAADTGVAVAVVKDGRCAFAGGFGFRDRAAGTAVDAETCFAIGSATKAFTSMAVSMLADQETFSLDQPIQQLLPEFAMKDPQAASQTTMLDILCHRTGLAPHNCIWFLGPFTRSQLFFRIRYLEQGIPFRSGYMYSNLMYMVAGYVLETLLGISYEEIIKTRILDPLGMTATDLSFAGLVDRPNHGKGYENLSSLALKDFSNISPAAAINSNVLDMAKWIKLFLRQGLDAVGNRLISQASLARMYTPFTDPGDGTKYGLGWNIGSVPVATQATPSSKRLVFHTGDPVGQSAYVSFMPDDSLGVIVLTNQQCTIPLVNVWPDKVATDIYDHLINGRLTGQLRLPQRTAAGGLGMTKPAPAVAAPSTAGGASPGSIVLRDYTGMYSNAGYGDFMISHSGSRLNISYYGSSWPLQPLSDTSFVVQIPAFGTIFPVQVVFARDGSTGAINGFAATLVLDPVIDIAFSKR